MKINIVVAAAVALSSLAGAAHARNVSVSTRHVDFSDAASVDALHREIAAAARTACGYSALRGIAGVRELQACRLQTLNAAVADMNMPMLTALNDSLDAEVRINGRRQPLTAVQLAEIENAVARLRAGDVGLLASGAS